MAAGEIELYNPALAGLLLRSDQNLAGRKLSEFLVEADGQRLIHALEDDRYLGTAPAGGCTHPCRYREESATCESRSLRLIQSWETGGNPVAIMEDVTALKHPGAGARG